MHVYEKDFQAGNWRVSPSFKLNIDAARILREIKLLRLLRHPDIVEIKHVMLPPSRRDYRDIYVVFELMDTDLHQVIKANDDLTKEHQGADQQLPGAQGPQAVLAGGGGVPRRWRLPQPGRAWRDHAGQPRVPEPRAPQRDHQAPARMFI
jgi:hypothetical protein